MVDNTTDIKNSQHDEKMALDKDTEDNNDHPDAPPNPPSAAIVAYKPPTCKDLPDLEHGQRGSPPSRETNKNYSGGGDGGGGGKEEEVQSPIEG